MAFLSDCSSLETLDGLFVSLQPHFDVLVGRRNVRQEVADGFALEALHGVAEAVEDDRQDHAQDWVEAFETILKLICREGEELAFAHGGDRRRPRPVVDDRHLAEDLSGDPPGDDHLLAAHLGGDFDRAALDHIGAVAGLSLMEDHRPLGNHTPVFVGLMHVHLRRRPELQ